MQDIEGAMKPEEKYKKGRLDLFILESEPAQSDLLPVSLH